jgi:hypothetical protein
MKKAVRGKLREAERKSMSSRWALRMIHSHMDWESNRLPRAGGLDDQPYKWVTAMRILDSEKASESIKFRAERAKVEARKGANYGR